MLAEVGERRELQHVVRNECDVCHFEDGPSQAGLADGPFECFDGRRRAIDADHDPWLRRFSGGCILMLRGRCHFCSHPFSVGARGAGEQGLWSPRPWKRGRFL